MENKKILVDVDGVLADSHKAFAEKISRQCKTEFSVDDITDWDFGDKIKSLGIGTSQCVDMFHQTWRDSWEQISLIDPKAIEILNKIKSNFNVSFDIVTANESVGPVKEWIDKHKVPYDHFIHNIGKHELEYSVYLEDNPNLAGILKPHQTLLLFDRPWNRKVENTKNIIRIHSFEEAERALRKIPERGQ